MTDQIDRLTAALAGRYAIEHELGAGGMATVYLAQDLKHQRKVAVKVLRPELAAMLGAERFIQEIATTAKLQHPQILPLFDSGEAASFLYYVTPFIDGETLRDRLNREKQLGVDDAVRITTEVADALETAHRQGVIHRDIKPENILLHNGRPIMADFGIALAVKSLGTSRLTETGLTLGTPHYMSPEQASGDGEIGPSSDVFALGCVLYEMLVGQTPHTGPTAQAIIAGILTEKPKNVCAIRKTVPPSVSTALERALEKVPADRYADAGAFGRALAHAGPRIGGGASPARFRRRFGAFVAIVLTVLLLIWSIPSGRTNPADSVGRIAVLPLENLTGAQEQDYFAMAMTEAVITQLTGVGLTVLSRQSVQRYAGSSEPLPAIASTLDVDAIVVGSVFGASERIRMDVRFIDGRDERQLWSRSFDTTLTAENVFDVQGKIAESIAAALELELSPESRARLGARPTTNLQALNAAQRGLYHWQNARSGRDYSLSAQYFREAIRHDSMYAEAWNGLAAVQSFVAATGASPNQRRDLHDAKAAALRALQIDPLVSQISGFPGSARGYLAFVKTYEWDFEGAERDYRRAIDELGETFSGPYHLFLAMMGRHAEAQRLAVEKLSQDPLNPFLRLNLVAILWWGREFERSLEATRDLPVLDQRIAIEAGLLFKTGRSAEGLEAVEALYAAPAVYRAGPFKLGAAFAIVDAIALHARQGRDGEARRHFREFRSLFGPDERPALIWAPAYLALGHEDAALRVLREGLERREGELAWLGQMSEFDPLREHPEFRAIVQTIGVPNARMTGGR